MARAIAVDVSVFSAGGVNLIADVANASYVIDVEHADGQGLSRLGKSPQATKRNGKIKTTAMSTVGGARVTNLDVSAFTFGGASYLADLQSANISGQFGTQMGDAVGDKWRLPNVTDMHFTGSFDLLVPYAALEAVVSKFHSATMSDLRLAWAITINGVALALPTVCKSMEWGADVGNLQMLKIGWEGQDPLTGTYPTTPAALGGTPTLLELAMVTPRDSIAGRITTKATNGYDSQCTLIWDSFDVKVENASTVKTEYAWNVYGGPTFATT